jgi:RHS repeat-associated protein
LAYNDRNLVESIVDKSLVTSYFSYDALGRRVAIDEGGELSYFTYDVASLRSLGAGMAGGRSATDGLCQLTERDASGGVTAEYVRGTSMVAGIGDLVGAKVIDGGTYYRLTTSRRSARLRQKSLRLSALSDHVGKVTLTTDETGAVTGRLEYNAFGLPLREQLPTPTTRHRYSAPAWLKLGELYLTPTRVYDPQTGRFLQQDPIGFADSPNLYFTNLAPKRTDPSGLKDGTVFRRQPKFWNEWTEEERKKWFEKFKHQYARPIVRAAKKHCVPAELLAKVIANEQLDYSNAEATVEIWRSTKYDQSVGVAQLRVDTIHKQKWYDEKTFRTYYRKLVDNWHFAGKNWTADEKERYAMAKYLQTTEGSIDSAALQLRDYMKHFCQAVLSGTRSTGDKRGTRKWADDNKHVSREFMSKVYMLMTRDDIKQICCNMRDTYTRSDCERIAKTSINMNLASTMSGYWNAGTSFPTVLDYSEPTNRGPKAMSYWARRLKDAESGLSYAELEEVSWFSVNWTKLSRG